MSIASRKIAEDLSRGLPRFTNLVEAEASLIAQKDALVADLLARSSSSPGLELDFSVDSLLRLESWYFDHPSEDLAACLAFYFGEVVVRSFDDARWLVEESVFAPGHYSIGVHRPLFGMNLRSFHEKLHHPRNRKRDSLWRTYQHYFARNPKVSIRF